MLTKNCCSHCLGRTIQTLFLILFFAVFNQAIAHASTGSLVGSSAPTESPVNLSALGTSDWAHWGTVLYDDFSFDHKATGGSQISNYTPIGSVAQSYSWDPTGYTWTDGMPTSSTLASHTGLVVLGRNNGFSFTVPADTSTRTLRAFVGSIHSVGLATLTAHLSDGSAVDYVGSATGNGQTYDQVFTLTYHAASAGQTLTVTWTQTTADSTNNEAVTLQSAALSMGQPTPDFTLTANPGNVTVQQGSTGSNAITVHPEFGFAGAVNMTASGLPDGVTASFSPNPATGDSVMTLSAAANVQPGDSLVTVTGTSGGLVHTTMVYLTVTPTPALNGALTGSGAATVGPINLTTGGWLDWAHWGTANAASFDHKAGGTQISNYTPVGPAANSYANNGIGYTWTDGTPTASATNTPTGLYTVGVSNGFSFTVPADTISRTLKVYVGGYQCTGTLTAHLSDGSAADFVQTASNASTSFNQTFTLTYHALTAGQVLTVSWVLTSGTGNLSLLSAALIYETVPDFSISTSPTDVYFPQGQSGSTTVTITRYNGFTGNVVLTANTNTGGLTISFSVNPMSSTSIVTFRDATGYTLGSGNHSYDILATSGNITHRVSGNVWISPAPDFGFSYAGNSAQYDPPHFVRGQAILVHFDVLQVGTFGNPITLSTPGLPAGVTATFSQNPAAAGTSVSVGLVAAADAQLGPFILTVSGTGGGLTHTVDLHLVTVVAQGSLAASSAPTTTPINLTALGSADWAHWGLSADLYGLDHKAGVVPLISTAINNDNANYTPYNTNTVGYTWTDGTPTASATATPTGLYVADGFDNFWLEVPADTITPRTLQVFLGGYASRGELLAHLSDSSAPDMDYRVSGTDVYNQTITLTYQAGSPGQRLTLNWHMYIADSINANVTIQAAALEVGIPTPDFDLFVDPQTTPSNTSQGSACYLSGQISPINGFNGPVHLSISGLPTGVTPTFNPDVTTGQFDLTFNVYDNAPVGSTEVTITATFGNLTHSTFVRLRITPPDPDFSLSTSSVNVSVAQGSTTTIPITMTPIRGFSDSVNYTVAGLPHGVIPIFSMNPAVGTTFLSLIASNNAVLGTSPITIWGNGISTGPIHVLTIYLTVNTPVLTSISVTPSPITVVPNGTQQFTVVGIDQNGGTIALPPQCAWSVSGGGSINSSTGLFTAGVTVGGPFIVTATSGSVSGMASVTVAAAPVGSLTGSGAVTAPPINLTSLGTSDWAHWGTTSAASFDHKATGGTQISNYTPVGPAANSYGNNGIGYTWTDGTPTGSATNTTTGLYTSGTNNGYSIIVPADTNVRTLKLYVGGYQCTGTLTAHLSDGSAADFVATASNATASYNQTFTLTYSAASAGKTLLVTWTQTSGTGNVTLQSAALIAGALTPDFNLSATPTSVTFARGGGGASTIAVNPANGFNSGVTLSASGLPTGVTAAFGTNPATGTSVLTFSANASAAIGQATVTITGTSGALTHAATVNLTVTPSADFNLSATPTSVSFARGSSGLSTITVNPTNGFNSGVTLSASGLPTGVTAVFGTKPATGTSVLTFSSSASATVGQATVTITGTSGALTHSATVNLTVTPQPVLTTITVNPASATIKTGTAQPFTALGKDQYGNLVSPQPAFAWSVSGGGAINASTGLFRAGNAIGGPFAVTAASGSISGTATVSVVYNPLIDFNGDGSADIVLQNAATSQIDLWYMSDFTLLGGMHVSSLPGIGWNVVGQGDFNGDGKADLVLQNASTGRVALWYMNGGVLVSGQYISAIPPAGWTVTAVGDFNGDGKPDLVLQNATTRQVAVWCMNNAVLTAGLYVSAIPGAGWNLAGVGDFNGDGKPDLVLQNATSGQVALWYLNGVTVTGGQYASATPGAGWHVSGVGDFNGDGKADLVLQNASSNQIAIWHMSGATVLSGLYVSVAPAAGLTVVGPE